MIYDSKPQLEAPRDPSVASAPARARRILVVDDEPAARILAQRLFSGSGFEVVTTSSGFDCLKEFRKRPHWFDLILLDLSMPFMDGEETFRRLRVMNPAVVVLLSTGFLGQAQNRIDRMLAGGLAGVIRKPHRPDELLSQVGAILERVKISRVGCAAREMSSFV
jgi:two-component system cell cycle sensor histidine kinase/response regulator CckA